MLKIVRLETFIIGDGPEIDPDRGGIEPLACLRVHTDDGLCGFSEVFRVPPGVVQATVGDRATHFGRLLIGQEITHPERLWQHVWDSLIHTNRRGWEIIILGALDVALWDIYGQALGQPVWRLLGGAERGPFQTHSDTRRTAIVPYCTLVSDVWGGEEMIAQQTERAARLLQLGYRAFKVEPMMSSPNDVVEMARRARRILGPDPTLMVDVGYLFNDVPTVARICRALEEFDICFFETPFPVDSPEPYARLAGQTSIPLAMGEHGVTRWEFLDMMDRGRVSVVQPYMTTCGGLTEAKRIVDLAVPRGALVCPGNWSTQILGTASVHLAAYSPVTPFIEFAPAEVFDSPLRRELQEAGLPVQGGEIAFPEAPGIGFRFPEQLAAKYRIA
ncbi:MAG TPA: mandelate racemase/muconate lactonizing enzyme family protein [Planctomycetaceae bacterium]|nr:mandelate racemase/muconate lactonizing enzyme family protein [Planctomycetaceae bacterium]